MEDNVIDWQTTSDKDKIRLLMTDVLRWPCYESWSEYRQRPDKDKPAAIWEDQGGGHRYWAVFSQPFNPLRRIEDAWQIVLHLRTVDQDVVKNFANALAYSLLDFLRLGSAEDICKAALKAVGYQIQERKHREQGFLT